MFSSFHLFLVSTYVALINSQSTKDGVFELWLPIGLIIILVYLYDSKSDHPSKVKASILGFLYSIVSVNPSVY